MNERRLISRNKREGRYAGWKPSPKREGRQHIRIAQFDIFIGPNFRWIIAPLNWR